MPAKAVLNLRPRSDQLYIERRDIVLADKTLADPNNAICLYDGEWLKIVAGKASRCTTIGTVGNANAVARVYPNFSGRGRTDVQALPEPAITLITGGPSTEWDTLIFDAAAVVGSGLAITADSQGLKVATISLSSPQGTRNFSGLVGHGGSGDSDPVVARVFGLPANNGGRLVFRLAYLGRPRPHQAPQRTHLSRNPHHAARLCQPVHRKDRHPRGPAEGS